METEPLKMIVGSCATADSRYYYFRQRALQYDGDTPVLWVADDNYGYGYDEDEALKALECFANRNFDSDYYYDGNIFEYGDSITKACACDNDAPLESEIDLSWYKGPGYYRDNKPLYLINSPIYIEGDMTYEVVDFIPADNE